MNKIAYDKGVFIFKIDDLLQKQKKKEMKIKITEKNKRKTNINYLMQQT